MDFVTFLSSIGIIFLLCYFLGVVLRGLISLFHIDPDKYDRIF
jgi:hypothetical protein